MSFPWATWPVTCSWACHVAAGNTDLGTDFGCPVGTPIVAAFDGTLSNGTRPEPAPFKSLYIAILRSDAYPNVSFEHMHLSRFQTPGHYKAGDVVGWTGGVRFALGSGRATGPHLHVNAIINGQLASVYSAFSEFASLNVIPLDNNTEEADMGDTAYIQMVDANGNDVNDWSRVGPAVLPVGAFTGGWEATADITVARVWGRQYVAANLGPTKLPRADYVAQQQFGHEEYLAHRADQVARMREVVGGGVGSFPTDYATKADVDALGVGINTVDGHVQAIRLPTKLTGTLG
jgi:murein DD-endopeptidase MepM/ murein hydrolase activator NlpD